MTEMKSWIDRNLWKRRQDGVRFYKELSIGDAIMRLQTAEGQETSELRLGVILSLTLYVPQGELAAPTTGTNVPNEEA